MATNAPAGDGHRNGAVRKRTELKTKVMGEEHYTKRGKKSGQFIDQKKDGKKNQGGPQGKDPLNRRALRAFP
jgi:hypothetical protein